VTLIFDLPVVSGNVSFCNWRVSNLLESIHLPFRVSGQRIGCKSGRQARVAGRVAVFLGTRNTPCAFDMSSIGC
jgi:hypothetical protein